jgi:hypothetical protein
VCLCVQASPGPAVEGAARLAQLGKAHAPTPRPPRLRPPSRALWHCRGWGLHALWFAAPILAVVLGPCQLIRRFGPGQLSKQERFGSVEESSGRLSFVR